MNAIDLLNEQHDEVDGLFAKAEKVSGQGKEKFFVQIADALAMHATIEEKIFYPVVKAKRTEDILLESLEEHLGIKRVLADMLDMKSSDETFDAKLKALKDQVEHHVKKEKTELFPKVKKLMDRRQLDELGVQMEAMISKIESTEPRFTVRKQTKEAAPLP